MTGMSILTTAVQHWVGSPNLINQTTERNKKHQNQQEELKPSLFYSTWKNPKDSTKKLLELTHEFSKAVRYKINGQKSMALPHIDNEAAERKIKECHL